MTKTAESVLKSARENNEPILVLRAKDKASLRALTKYLHQCKSMKCDKEHIEGVGQIIEDFKIFRKENPEQMKTPD